MKSVTAAPALAAIVLASCGGAGSKPQVGYQLDSSMASAIPADTVALLGGRWDLLRKSPLYAKAVPLLPGEGAGGLVSRFGLDPNKDIKEFVAAYNGKEPVFLISGSFRSNEVLDKAARETGGQRTNYQGKPLVIRGGSGGLAALSASILAAGSEPRLHECIDRLAQSAKLEERWTAGLRSLPAQTQIWVLSTGGMTMNLPGNLGNVDKVLSSLDSLAGWGDLSRGVRLSLTGSTREASAAKQLHTQLRGLIGMGRLSTPDNRPEMLKLFDAIQTKQDDQKIVVDVDLAEAALDTLLKQMR